MDAAEHLAWQVDPVRRARRDPIERGAARPINARQAQHARAALQPHGIRRDTPAAPPRNGRAFIDPAAIAVAIDSGRGKIAEPSRRPARDRVAISGKDGITVALRRRAGEDVARAIDRGLHSVGGGIAAGRRDFPAIGAQCVGDARSGITGAEKQHERHYLFLSSRRALA